MVGVQVGARRVRRGDDGETGKAPVVLQPKLSTLGVKSPGLAQLLDTDGREDVAQVGFDAVLGHLVAPSLAVTYLAPETVALDAVHTDAACLLRRGRLAEGDHAAFAGGNGLVGVKAEDGGVRGAVAD